MLLKKWIGVCFELKLSISSQFQGTFCIKSIICLTIDAITSSGKDRKLIIRGIATEHVNCGKSRKNVYFSIVTSISRTHFIHKLMEIKFKINKRLD